MQLDPLESDYKSVDPISSYEKGKTKSTKVVCPSCSNSVSSDEINIQDKIAKCNSCHEVFSFQHELQSLFANTPGTNKPVLGKQKDIDVYEYKGELNISILNFTDWIAFIALFVSIFGTLITFGASSKHGFSPIPFLIPIGLIFIFSIFRFVNYRKNKVFIDIDDKYLYVRNRPKNFIKDKSYLVENIRQFYPKIWGEGPYYYLYMIYDGPEGEEHIKLTPYLRSRSRALYLEQELESFLGIPDEIVPEEAAINLTRNLNK